MQKYRSLAAWRHARDLCLATLEAADQARGPRTWAVLDQLKRAAVSVEANIVEGFAYGTRRAFRRHLRIAIGSAAEVEVLLEHAQRRTYLPEETTAHLQAVTDRCIAALFGLIRSLPDRDESTSR